MRKPEQRYPQFRKNLSLITNKEIYPDVVNKGRFFMVRTMAESQKMTGVLVLGEDAEGMPMRVQIYNADYTHIPANQWLAIKEPLFKRGNDGLELIRVDDPSDVEFFDAKSVSTMSTMFNSQG